MNPSPTSNRPNWKLIPIKLLSVYAFISLLWIIASDFLLEEVADDVNTYNGIKDIKYWVYLLVSATMMYVLMYSDVSAMKRSHEAVERQFILVSLLNQITRAIALRQDLRGILHVVLEHLHGRLAIPFAAVCVLDSHTERLVVMALSPEGEGVARQAGLALDNEIPLAHAGLENLARDDLVYLPSTSGATEGIPRGLAESGLHSLVAVQMRVAGKVFGLLVVARSGEKAFADVELNFLTVLGEQMALAINQTRLYQDLQLAYEELRKTQEAVLQQQRLRALGQMASGIAHDFNNTLSPIIGFTELLLLRPSDLDETKERHYLTTIRTAAQDAALIVRRLREFYRERGQSEVFLPVKLNRLVDQVISMTQPKWKDQALSHGASIHIETDFNPLPDIAGNESELREALTNLVFNAVDAMPEGGTITLRTRAIGIHALDLSESQLEAATAEVNGADGGTAIPMNQTGDSTPATVILEVVDTGTGMPEAVRLRCLDPFFTTKGERGTGLGLALVYGIMKRHEGSIDIETREGKGTTFRLTFPVPHPREATATEPTPLLSLPRPLSVLLVDDDDKVREVTAEFLTRDGHAVVAAREGREGFEKFNSGWFDLVISDQSMPEMTGDELATAIQRVAPGKPVLLLTGFGDMLEVTSGKPNGVRAVISKPVSLNTLREAIAASIS